MGSHRRELGSHPVILNVFADKHRTDGGYRRSPIVHHRIVIERAVPFEWDDFPLAMGTNATNIAVIGYEQRWEWCDDEGPEWY